MRAFVGDRLTVDRGLCPINGVGDYFADIGVEEGFAGLVSRLEPEDLSGAADKAATAAEYVSVLKPASEHERVGLGNIERLGVHFLLLEDEMIGDSRRDRMRGHEIPHDLALIASPLKVAVGADYRAEGLGVVG